MLADNLYEQCCSALWETIFLSALPLGASLICGFLSALVQAATQIQDQALSFVPRLIAVGCALWFASPILADHFHEFVSTIYLELAHVHNISG